MTQGIIFHHGGAVSRVPEDATAAGNRAAEYMAHPIACWSTPDQTDYEMDWVTAVLRGDRARGHGWHLPELRAGHVDERPQGRLRGGEAREARRVEGRVGPDQPVPVQPQRPADRLVGREDPTAVPLARLSPGCPVRDRTS